MPIDKELIKSKIHSREDISLKTIADIVVLIRCRKKSGRYGDWNRTSWRLRSS